MEIPEVPIRQEEKSTKPPSHKIVKAADEYLAEEGIHVEQLNDQQQQCVFKYIKAKKAMKWWVIVGILSGLVFMVLSLYWYSFISRFADDFMPDNTVIELDDGTEKVIQLDREVIGTYGTVCAVFGGVLVVTLYSAVSVFVGLFSSISNIRSTQKIFDAFLPSIGSSPSIESKNNIGFDNTQ